MVTKTHTPAIISSIFGILIIILGVFYLVLVHFVPAIICFLLSLIYFPFADELLKRKFGFPVPLIVKILLGIFIIWFTLGVSDLGDMIDKL